MPDGDPRAIAPVTGQDRADAPAGGASGDRTPLSPSECEELERLLREVSATIRQRGRLALADLGITPPQFDALNTLHRCGTMTMGDLCERLHVAYSTLSDLVDRMQRAELVRRCRDQGDRRVVYLHLTPRGAEVIEAVLQTRRAYVGAVLSALSTGQQAMVTEAVRLLHAQVTAPGAP